MIGLLQWCIEDFIGKGGDAFQGVGGYQRKGVSGALPWKIKKMICI